MSPQNFVSEFAKTGGGSRGGWPPPLDTPSVTFTAFVQISLCPVYANVFA